jgi:hypothetical protein
MKFGVSTAATVPRVFLLVLDDDVDGRAAGRFLILTDAADGRFAIDGVLGAIDDGAGGLANGLTPSVRRRDFSRSGSSSITTAAHGQKASASTRPNMVTDTTIDTHRLKLDDNG